MSLATPAGRRVVTEPASLQRRTTDLLGEPKTSDLYNHANAKVVSFTLPEHLEKTAPGKGSAASAIPWKRSAEVEQVVLLGRLRVFQTPSETLRMGGDRWSIQLMPASRCWCVDDQAQFAMKRSATVYRIELPQDTADDKAKIEEFKKILDEQIRYEKDPSPFRKGFEVEAMTESPTAVKMKLVGTNRGQMNPFSQVKLRSTKRASIATTEATSDVSDEDAGIATPPAQSYDGQTEDMFGSPTNGSHIYSGLKLRPEAREDSNTETRSFTAPIFSRPRDPDSPPSTSSSTEKISDEVEPDTPLPSTSGAHASFEDMKAIEPVEAPSINESILQHTSEIAIDPSTQRSSTPDSFGQELTPHAGGNTDAQASSVSDDVTAAEESGLSSSPVDSVLPVPSSTAPLVLETEPSPERTEVSNSITVLEPVSTPSVTTSPPRALSSPRQRKSSASTTASRAADTPPLQPLPKAASTTRTTVVTSPRYRHSSLMSEDDIPSLGVFSQITNVLLGPPSGLLAVLVGVARRVGSLGRSATASASSLGLGRRLSTNDDGGDGVVRPGLARSGRSGMPGSWDSEDDGATVSSSDVDEFTASQYNGLKKDDEGLKKKHSWTTAYDRAVGQDAAAKPKMKERQLSNHEWTDDDLD